jgi:hypothetical protein
VNREPHRTICAPALSNSAIRHRPMSFRPEWADASLHLRSCEGVGPRSGEISLRRPHEPPTAQLNRYSSATKMPRFQPSKRVQPANFDHLPKSCSIRALLAKQLCLSINNLQPLFCALLPLFARPIFCFQHLMDSFLQNRGVGVSLSKKSKTNRVKGCQQVATLEAS